MNIPSPRQNTRRAFLRDGTLVLAAASPVAQSLAAPTPASRLRFGLVTDLHYADKPAVGTRYYRETLDKLAEAQDCFRESSLAFLVELGDLIDAGDSIEAERASLQQINRAFSTISDDRHYVLGNHCVQTLRKDEVLDQVGQERSFYSFRRAGIHLIVLDACFRHDGVPYGRKNFQWTDTNIPPEEIDWLAAELAKGDEPVLVFAHQRLDVSNHYSVRNHAAVRQQLEQSGRVLAVFQGHSHHNDHREIGGIHYCTCAAMVEGSGANNNAYSVVDIHDDGTIRIEGFRQQHSYHWHTH